MDEMGRTLKKTTNNRPRWRFNPKRSSPVFDRSIFTGAHVCRAAVGSHPLGKVRQTDTILLSQRASAELETCRINQTLRFESLIIILLCLSPAAQPRI